jgi:hypothetical protein
MTEMALFHELANVLPLLEGEEFQKFRSEMAWDKVIIGTGYWTRGQHEKLLICTRGKIDSPHGSSCPMKQSRTMSLVEATISRAEFAVGPKQKMPAGDPSVSSRKGSVVTPGQRASDETGARTRAAQNSIPAVRYAIYDGRLLVATVRRIGKKFEVRHAKRRLTGRFSSFKAALAAINDHAEHDHNRAPHGRK